MPKRENKPHARCGARRRDGKPCTSTFVAANGRCRMHGGKVGDNHGAPKDNKNAVTTGEYESIFADVLEDDERDTLRQIAMDKMRLLEDEIGLTIIRERRMMKRIATLKDNDGGLELTTVEIVDEQGDDFTKSKSKRRGTLGQIQDIEDALTRVQAIKTRLIELKHKFEMELGSEGDDDGFERLADAIKESAKLLKGR